MTEPLALGLIAVRNGVAEPAHLPDRKALRSLVVQHFGFASELLEQIAASGLSHVEVPVTIDYTKYSLGKGQLQRFLGHPVRPLSAKVAPMIAQIGLSILLTGVLVYAWTEYRRLRSSPSWQSL
jgi:hypothetical protein